MSTLNFDINNTFQSDLRYCAFKMKQTVEDAKVKDKISAAEVNIIKSKCQKVINWLNLHQNAEKDEFEYQKKELEKVCNPILDPGESVIK